MFSNILGSLKDSVAGELIEKAGVSEDQLPQIFDQIGKVTKEKLGSEVASGNLDSVMNLFSKKGNTPAASGIQSSLTSGIVSSLAGKFGIDESKANMIATIVIPKLMSLITNKSEETPDSDSSFLSGMLGGGSGDIMGKAKDALGVMFS